MNKQLALIEEHKTRARLKKRNCFYHKCNVSAIESHLLQKNGIINQITEDGHVYEYIFHPFENQIPMKFRKIGINKVFTFKGFCNYHDNALFKDIESKEFDLSNNLHQLLYAYRTSLNEFRKKEIVIDYYNSIKEDSRITIIPHKSIIGEIEGQKLGLKDGKYTQSKIIESINNPDLQNFTFYYREFKKVKLCICAVYTFETSEEIRKMQLFDVTKYEQPLTDVFINLIPRKDKTCLSIGFIKGINNTCDKFFDRLFNQGTEQELQKYITSVMLLQIENWIMSGSFYIDKILSREDYIKTIITWAQDNWNERIGLNINFFE